MKDTSVGASRSAGHGRKFKRMVLEKAGNGVVSTTEYHPGSGDKEMMMYDSSQREEKNVHPTAAHPKKHVATVMFGKDDDEGDKGKPGAKS